MPLPANYPPVVYSISGFFDRVIIQMKGENPRSFDLEPSGLPTPSSPSVKGSGEPSATHSANPTKTPTAAPTADDCDGKTDTEGSLIWTDMMRRKVVIGQAGLRIRKSKGVPLPRIFVQ